MGCRKMTRIRKIEISNFRSIQDFEWCPSNNFNCLIGPGDSGKSTILDAIDLCLGVRWSWIFADADFHNMNVKKPIIIRTSVGNLSDELVNFERYGEFIRGFDKDSCTIEDEPAHDLESVLTVELAVSDDLEPNWRLHSERAVKIGKEQNLKWADRRKIAPIRIGSNVEQNLAWRRGSLLNRMSDDKADASAALARVIRVARKAFKDESIDHFDKTLRKVTDTSKEQGIPVGKEVQALIDAHSAALNEGMISLHDDSGIPLRNLGMGSTRLLVASLQRRLASSASALLIDELEHGLEPHRIIRLIGSLGAKGTSPRPQVFATTHSSVALQELSGDQLYVVRKTTSKHTVEVVGTGDANQGMIRQYPHAFLAKSIIICEGMSEVALLRGLDQFRVENEDESSFTAYGLTLVDNRGGDADRIYRHASPLLELGYRVAVLHDDDQKPSRGVEVGFKKKGGTVFKWSDGLALEQEMFASASDEAVGELLDYAREHIRKKRINEHLNDVSQDAISLEELQTAVEDNTLSPDQRQVIGDAAKKHKWFKKYRYMEYIGRKILGPDLEFMHQDFSDVIDRIFDWVEKNADV